MARQLVFTSAPQGLTPGRTGYCTVARHRDLRDRLATALEGLSSYPSDWQPAPVVCTFRLVDVGGTRFPILSRMVSAGEDYTHRSAFLAHHLVLEPEEAASAPPPAEILRRWPGWRNRWVGPPRWFDAADLVDVAAMRVSIPPALPADTWANLAGDAGRATLLLEGIGAATRMLRYPLSMEAEVLDLLSEASALLPPTEWWRTEFTTCFQSSDSSASFRWAAVRAGSPADTPTRGGNVIDLTRPENLPAIAESTLVRRARGTTLQPAAPVVAATPAKPTPRPVVVPLAAAPNAPATAAPAAAPRTAVPAPWKPPRKTVPLWVYGAAAGILVGGAIVAVLFWPRQPAAPTPAPTPAPAPLAPPVFVANTTPEQPPAIAPANDTTSPSTHEPTALNASPPAPDNDQALAEIQQMARNGDALGALTKWKDLAATAPNFTAKYASVFNSTLTSARQEWINAVNKIKNKLSTGQTPVATLMAQLEALRDFPGDWPVSKPEDLTKLADSVSAMLAMVAQLPDAPVWVADAPDQTGQSAGYTEGAYTLDIPDLAKLFAAGPGKFHVSVAPATSLRLPPAPQWYNFTILALDYQADSYLILHDASRGAAGGRLMELDADRSGKFRLTWRMFQADTEFFRHYPANAPLLPSSRYLWLHFAGDAPLPSFYVLLQRLGAVADENWKPLAEPIAWLQSNGSPPRVSLPPWLASHLLLQTPTDQGFHLEPTNLDNLMQNVHVEQIHTNVAASAAYDASLLADKLNDECQRVQIDQDRATQLLTQLQGITDPARKPLPSQIQQASKAVQNLTGQLNKLKNDLADIAKTKWPSQVTPWLLYSNTTATPPLVYLQFSPQ